MSKRNSWVTLQDVDSGKRVLVNLDNATCISELEDSEDEVIIHFDNSQYLKVKGNYDGVMDRVMGADDE